MKIPTKPSSMMSAVHQLADFMRVILHALERSGKRSDEELEQQVRHAIIPSLTIGEFVEAIKELPPDTPFLNHSVFMNIWAEMGRARELLNAENDELEERILAAMPDGIPVPHAFAEVIKLRKR